MEIRQQDELANSYEEFREWLYFMGIEERPPSDGDEQPERFVDSKQPKRDIPHQQQSK